MITNKQGADKIISVYWFAILFIVAAAVVYMVLTFYGKPYDVREIEADLLTDKIADCVSYAGYLKEGIFEETFRENFLETCNLNLEVEDVYGWNEQGQYFIRLQVYGFEDYPGAVPLLSIQEGNSNLESFCQLQGDQLPFCLKRQIYTLDESDNTGKSYVVQILSVIAKTEKNA